MNTPFSIDGAVRLTHWGVIRARGADAAKFLHGQLTNDTLALDGSQARLAGYCSAKGRLLASFIVWQAAPDEILLACHQSVLPATLKRLSMFVLRAACKLSDASAEVVLTGVAGASTAASTVAATDAATAGLPVWGQRGDALRQSIRLPDAAGVPRALLASRVRPGEESDTSPASMPEITLAHWQWLEVQSGVATIEAATAEQFVPQMLNFELVGGVNFQKGCYPGQEVVARSQYRGSVKRRMFLFDSAGSAAPGQEVFHSGDATQPAGMVANAAARPDGMGCSALVEVKLAALESGSLHLGTADGALLARAELPYRVEALADTA